MSQGPAAVDPVDRAVVVTLPPHDAWDLFTTRLQDWWPLKSHSCSGDPKARVVFEPRAGGAVVEIASNGERHAWGTLTEWAPPHALAMTWHPAQPTDQATRLRITFEAVGSGTEVRVRHDGWEARGAASEAARHEYDRGWPIVLQGLARLAERQRPDPRNNG